MTDLSEGNYPTGDLPFPQARTCPYSLPAEYEQLRKGGPLHRVTLYDGGVAWLVNRHKLARRLLADPRLSSDRSHPNFPAPSPEMKLMGRHRRPPLLGADPPEHGVHRRMLLSDFTGKRIRSLRPEIEKVVQDSLDVLVATGPPADLVTRFSLRVPSAVICLLLGVPYDDHEFFQDASQRLVQPRTAEDAQAARNTLGDYLDRLIVERQRRPGPGLINRLVHEQLARGELDREDLVSMSIMLLVAGHDSTAAMISLGALTLLEHPDQLAALRANPSAMPTAVEELLRYLSVADIAGLRVATDDIDIDIDIDGRTIRAGDGVIIANSIPNRDDEAFDEPDTFDVHRSARHHLAFGYGAHSCLGQNLARVELEAALTALFARIPTVRIAVPVDELILRPATTIQGVNELPVTW